MEGQFDVLLLLMCSSSPMKRASSHTQEIMVQARDSAPPWATMSLNEIRMHYNTNIYSTLMIRKNILMQRKGKLYLIYVLLL